MYCSRKEEQPKGAGDAGEQRGWWPIDDHQRLIYFHERPKFRQPAPCTSHKHTDTHRHTHTLFDLHAHPAPAPSTFHMHPAFAPCRLHVCTFQLHPMPSTCNVRPSHVPRTRALDYTMVPPCNCTCTMPMPLLHPTHALPHRTHAPFAPYPCPSAPYPCPFCTLPMPLRTVPMPSRTVPRTQAAPPTNKTYQTLQRPHFLIGFYTYWTLFCKLVNIYIYRFFLGGGALMRGRGDVFISEPDLICGLWGLRQSRVCN